MGHRGRPQAAPSAVGIRAGEVEDWHSELEPSSSLFLLQHDTTAGAWISLDTSPRHNLCSCTVRTISLHGVRMVI